MFLYEEFQCIFNIYNDSFSVFLEILKTIIPELNNLSKQEAYEKLSNEYYILNNQQQSHIMLELFNHSLDKNKIQYCLDLKKKFSELKDLSYDQILIEKIKTHPEYQLLYLKKEEQSKMEKAKFLMIVVLQFINIIFKKQYFLSVFNNNLQDLFNEYLNNKKEFDDEFFVNFIVHIKLNNYLLKKVGHQIIFPSTEIIELITKIVINPSYLGLKTESENDNTLKPIEKDSMDIDLIREFYFIKNINDIIVLLSLQKKILSNLGLENNVLNFAIKFIDKAIEYIKNLDTFLKKFNEILNESYKYSYCERLNNSLEFKENYESFFILFNNEEKYQIFLHINYLDSIKK